MTAEVASPGPMIPKGGDEVERRSRADRISTTMGHGAHPGDATTMVIADEVIEVARGFDAAVALLRQLAHVEVVTETEAGAVIVKLDSELWARLQDVGGRP